MGELRKTIPQQDNSAAFSRPQAVLDISGRGFKGTGSVEHIFYL